jgi:Protein of unknown function (DUF501)
MGGFGAWQDNANDPVVVQLYPLVCRSPHAGGKAGGLRFKARKRKSCQQQQQQQYHGKNDKANPEQPSDAMQQANNEVAAHCNTIDTNGDQDPSTKEDDEAKSLVIEPFPTIYWLTHPLLSSWISQLERDGYGIQWERRLAAHSEDMASMQRAHAAYAHQRLSLLTDGDVRYMRQRHWDSALAVTTRGVAGSTNPVPSSVCTRTRRTTCRAVHRAPTMSLDNGS